MSYPIDPDDLPTTELRRQLEEIISVRNGRANASQCAYCGQDLKNPNHACRYAADPNAFHPHPNYQKSQGNLFP